MGKYIKRTLLVSLTGFIICTSCGNAEVKNSKQEIKTVSTIKTELNNPSSNYIMICAHRGEKSIHPENSLSGLQECIDQGVDIIEIDLQETKDGELIILHDDTLGRTTTGKGKVSELTLENIKQESLKTKAGIIVPHKVPTLKEYLNLARGKILIQIDKWPPVRKKVLQILDEYDCLGQSIFRGTYSTSKVKSLFGKYLNDIIYIPVVVTNRENAYSLLQDYKINLNTPAISLIFDNEDDPLLNEIPELKRKYRIWFNAILEQESCAGHGDYMSAQDPSRGYGWLINKGANIIFSGKPSFLNTYLKKNGYR